MNATSGGTALGKGAARSLVCVAARVETRSPVAEKGPTHWAKSLGAVPAHTQSNSGEKTNERHNTHTHTQKVGGEKLESLPLGRQSRPITLAAVKFWL